MAHVITAQPTPNSKEYTAVVPDAETVETMAVEEVENEEKRKRKNSAAEDCCCYIAQDHVLYDYWCIRSLADLFVACGMCTESVCDRCCCACETENHNQKQGCDGGCSDCCASDNCCECDTGCCEGDSGGCECGDCDCGGCNCGGCDCDCGGCDF